MKILVVEDDPAIAEMVRIGLTADGHVIDIAENGTEGSFLARSYNYNVIILDNSLPKKDGVTVTKEVRGIGVTTPIIFLSITGDTDTKVRALESGADDYMTKPFSMDELRARIKAVARRTPVVHDTEMNVHDLFLDPTKRTARRGNKNIHLTKKEFAMLEYMIRNKGIVLSRAQIMEHAWTADSDPFSNTVEAHIRNLRKKINDGSKEELIANRPGHGYVIDTPEGLKA